MQGRGGAVQDDLAGRQRSGRLRAPWRKTFTTGGVFTWFVFGRSMKVTVRSSLTSACIASHVLCLPECCNVTLGLSIYCNDLFNEGWVRQGIGGVRVGGEVSLVPARQFQTCVAP